MIKLGIVLTPDVRSKAYLQKCIQKNYNFSEVILMNDNRQEPHYSKDETETAKRFGFNILDKVKDTLSKNEIEFIEFNFVDINNIDLIKHVQNSDIDCYVFTGGGILREQILSCGKKFLHFHPGIAPDYKGSTCFYYSMINDDSCGVTAFIMNIGLDTGDIVYQRRFSKPNHIFIDNVFDAYIRSETLIDVLEKKLLEKENFTKQNPKSGETYYIIHPILKHIATLSCINQDINDS